jgi:hypothetical protein
MGGSACRPRYPYSRLAHVRDVEKDEIVAAHNTDVRQNATIPALTVHLSG